ncbi:MAG: hypothetical protein A2Y79_14690 [Deltaproteobacteria bacterium RBG_13_43_22]|nr:MAG: hypothetical protein A2Y79_14690 [Deltaproteobacteria bacterium RBG_13_43_22]
MKDEEKTKAQLIEELKVLRGNFSEMESSLQATKVILSRYQDFIENVDDLCSESDLAGKFIFTNTALSRKLGYTLEEFLQLKREDRYASPEEARRTFQIYTDLYRKGKGGERFYAHHRSKEGKILTLEISASLVRDAEGNPVGFRGIGRDVTDKIKREQEQERYRKFFESIDDICFENDLQGNVIFMNEALCRILDLGREELQNMNFRQFVTEDTGNQIFERYNEIYRTGKPAQLFNFEIIRKDGIGKFLDITVSLIRDAEGSPIGFRGVARDVTERKRLEEEQEGLREQINQVRKLESIGTLAGGIAHDFNNLLMGIQGCASLMLMDIDSQHPHYKPLKTIESQVQSGAYLTKQLLGYARRGRYEVKSTDLNELLAKTVSVFSRTNKGIHIYQKYEKLLWKTEVDQGQIEQVFLDLFLNAAEVMPGGGSLYLETENTILDEHYIKPYEITPGAYVKISVTDTGTGMDEETMLRIFDPFFTTKDMTRGAGLGLASAYGIIKGHKGIINVYSEKGHGTTFKIFLPAEHQEEIRQEKPAIETVKKQITLLFVDDEKAITDVTGAMLERMGHRVIIANGGKDAVALYRMNRDRIDLVIMDMTMPDMSGGEAIEKIRSINPEVQVILSSGYSLNGMAREIMNRGGVQAFLQKPFQMNLLSKKINEVLGV